MLEACRDGYEFVVKLRRSDGVEFYSQWNSELSIRLFFQSALLAEYATYVFPYLEKKLGGEFVFFSLATLCFYVLLLIFYRFTIERNVDIAFERLAYEYPIRFAFEPTGFEVRSRNEILTRSWEGVRSFLLGPGYVLLILPNRFAFTINEVDAGRAFGPLVATLSRRVPQVRKIYERPKRVAL